MDAGEVYPHEMHAREVHAHETHAYEIHAREMFQRGFGESLQISHLTNGGAVASLSLSRQSD
jgi:hypothetical protein